MISTFSAIREARHDFDTAVFMEQVQLVQLEKELVEFLLKFDALVGVFEYALAFGFGKLFQTLTVQFQRFRFADGFFRYGVQHGFQAGDEPASRRNFSDV